MICLTLPAWIACLLATPASALEPSRPVTPPTYAGDVAKILHAKCLACHRTGQSGPFALETYEQARKRADDIAEIVESRKMPPWMPEPGVGPPIKGDQSLTREQIATLKAWAAAGAPQGDAAATPALPEVPDDWKLGPPDLVLEPTEDFRIDASGRDLYRCFVLPTNLGKDVYVSAIDFRPGNRRVVHHMAAYIIPSGTAKHLDDADSGPGYTWFSGPGVEGYEVFGFWSAGHETSHLPAGIGMPLPNKADMILQVHYHPTGKVEVDRTRIGLYLSRTPVKQSMYWNAVQDVKFVLPAGEANAEVKAEWYLPVDVEVLAVSPHMHLLGKSMSISVKHPNGKTQDLIRVPEWDPSWQSAYFYRKPVTLRRGSVIKVDARFDNSPHERNPNSPPKPVHWGQGANDEMCDGYVALVKKGQDLNFPGTRDDLAIIFAQQRLKNYLKATARRR